MFSFRRLNHIDPCTDSVSFIAALYCCCFVYIGSTIGASFQRACVHCVQFFIAHWGAAKTGFHFRCDFPYWKPGEYGTTVACKGLQSDICATHHYTLVRPHIRFVVEIPSVKWMYPGGYALDCFNLAIENLFFSRTAMYPIFFARL